jgi:hypothetical protein
VQVHRDAPCGQVGQRQFCQRHAGLGILVDWSKTNPLHSPKVPTPHARTAKQRGSAEVSHPPKGPEPPRRRYRFNYR